MCIFCIFNYKSKKRKQLEKDCRETIESFREAETPSAPEDDVYEIKKYWIPAKDCYSYFITKNGYKMMHPDYSDSGRPSKPFIAHKMVVAKCTQIYQCGEYKDHTEEQIIALLEDNLQKLLEGVVTLKTISIEV